MFVGCGRVILEKCYKIKLKYKLKEVRFFFDYVLGRD